MCLLIFICLLFLFCLLFRLFLLEFIMSMTRSDISFLGPDFRFVSKSSPKLRVSISFPAQGRTKQQFKDEADINVLMARYACTGILDGSDPTRARYMDVSEFQDLRYEDALNFVAEAQSQFYELPAKIRDRFHNDPGELIAFMDDPANAQEAISLGLVRDPTLAAPTVPLASVGPSTPPSPSTGA